MSTNSSLETQDVWLERMELNGRTLGAIAYGVFATLTIQCLDIMINKPKPGQRRWPMFIYVVLLFVLETIAVAGDTKNSQTVWVDGRYNPGGPDSLIKNAYGLMSMRLAAVCCIVIRWISDALLLYRCYTVWRTERFVYFIIFLPFLAYITDYVLGIMTIVKMWENALFSGDIVASTEFALSVALNILVTLLIVWRLLATRRTLRHALGAEHAKTYTSIAAMLIESAALFSIVGMIYIIAFGRQSNVQSLFLPSLGVVQGIAPMLIILRVVQGREWSNDLSTRLSFAANPAIQTSLVFSRHPRESFSSRDLSQVSTAEKVDRNHVVTQTEA